MSLIEEVRQAVQRSKAEWYLGGWDNTTRELSAAVDALRTLETALRLEIPSTAQRRRLMSEIMAFRSELRLAERLHSQASGWEAKWALAVQDALGLRAAAYGPDGAAQSGRAIRSMAWEG